MTILIIGLIFLVLCSGFLSASETALFSLNSMQVSAFQKSKDNAKQLIARLLKNPRRLLVTILMLNVGVNILSQNVVSSLFGNFATFALTVGVPFALTLIFGEVFPKSLAYAKNLAIARCSAPVLRLCEKGFYYPCNAIIYIANAISRAFFFFLRRGDHLSLSEINHSLLASHSRGIVNEEETVLIQGYLNLENEKVHELMTPKEDIAFYDIHRPLEELLTLFSEKGYSRVPVCDLHLDKILGIVTAGSFFLHQERIHNSIDLLPFLRKPLFILESLPGHTLLRTLREKEESVAIVVDEYGVIVGLVTFEDLSDVIIGNAKGEKALYTRVGKEVIIASGRLEIAQFEKIFGVSLQAVGVATIGGYLTEKMGDIPKNGQTWKDKHFLFHVLSATNRVRRLYIRRLKGGK